MSFMRLNVVVMSPSSSILVTNLRASLPFKAFSARFKTSGPQHLRTWQHKLFVDNLSSVALVEDVVAGLFTPFVMRPGGTAAGHLRVCLQYSTAFLIYGHLVTCLLFLSILALTDYTALISTLENFLLSFTISTSTLQLVISLFYSFVFLVNLSTGYEP